MRGGCHAAFSFQHIIKRTLYYMCHQDTHNQHPDTWMKHNIIPAVTPTDLFSLQTHSIGQKGSPRLRHFGFVLHWETSFALLGCRTSTVVVRTTTTTSSRLRIPVHSQGSLVMIKCQELIHQSHTTTWPNDEWTLTANSKDTHLKSLPSQAEGWVCVAWQSRIWPAVPGSWAGTQMP